jgi:hypothetical protein
MLFLYGTSACHLCEEAHALLVSLKQEMHIAWSEIDIVEDNDLMQHYGLKIPVLYQSDNHSELCWPFSLSDIRNFLITQPEKQKAG